MPTYLYACACREEEVIHSIHDNPKITCEDCKKVMQRKPQGASVTFKGSGFYTTDKSSAQ